MNRLKSIFPPVVLYSRTENGLAIHGYIKTGETAKEVFVVPADKEKYGQGFTACSKDKWDVEVLEN